MSFSSLSPALSDRESDALPARHHQLAVPLAEAWGNTSQVRRLEFSGADSSRWTRAIQALGNAIQKQVTRHILEAERDDSLPRTLAADGGSAGYRARALLTEHLDLAFAISEFARRCAVTSVETIWTVVDVCERAIALEILLAGHHNRLVALTAAVAHGPTECAHAESST